jgi:hypothetical protein
MRHIRQVDGKEHTVLMMQVENEVGRPWRLAGPHCRRQRGLRRAGAQGFDATIFASSTRTPWSPELRQVWGASNGFKTSGTWEEVFGRASRNSSHPIQRLDRQRNTRHPVASVQAGRWTKFSWPGATPATSTRWPPLARRNTTSRCIATPGCTVMAGQTTPGGALPAAARSPMCMTCGGPARRSIDILAPDLYNRSSPSRLPNAVHTQRQPALRARGATAASRQVRIQGARPPSLKPQRHRLLGVWHRGQRAVAGGRTQGRQPPMPRRRRTPSPRLTPSWISWRR